MAIQKIREMLKKIYPDGEVNASQVWKGYDNGTGRTGWHVQKFGENAQYMGKSVAEVAEYVEDVASGRENA